MSGHHTTPYASATRFMMLFSVVAALIMPVGFFVISYQNLVGILETEAEINSEAISRLVRINPELWRYETIRIEELLARRPRSGKAETRRIFDKNNVPVAESVNTLSPPLISASYEIQDGEDVVGRLEITRSILPLFLQSSALALFGLFFGLLFYRWLPFNEIISSEKKLKEANVFLMKVMEGSTSSLVVLDLNGNITMFNGQFEALTGFPPADIQLRSFRDLFSDDSLIQVTSELQKVTIDGVQKVMFETDFQRQDGLELHLFCGAVPLVNDGVVSGVIVSLDDITERIEAEDERLEFERKLQQTQKLESLGVLAGGIAHDFNNILTIILGYCYVFRDEVAPDSTHAEYIKKIEGASERAADLCRQMLSYAGRHEIIYSRINMTVLVDEMVKMLHSGIKKNVTIEVNPSDSLLIIADGSQIQQIIMNLIINAAEAIGSNKGTIRIALNRLVVPTGQPDIDIFGKTIRDGQYVCMEVSDNGCGMDEATQHRIFEPFFTTKFTGRGLGMSSTLGIIKSHDGALQLSSAPGVGSTFKVYLPLPVEATRSEKAQATHQMFSAKSDGTVLLIDDEDELLTLGTIRLAKIGYTPITAANGEEALTIFKNQKENIDLILLDLLMPEMDGVETYHRLREMSKTVPIVFCSGCSKNDLSSDILDDAHTDFIKKPYNPEQLRNVLVAMLG